eukprot:1603436-Pleurochrysis_carterae.AAC.2
MHVRTLVLWHEHLARVQSIVRMRPHKYDFDQDIAEPHVSAPTARGTTHKLKECSTFLLNLDNEYRRLTLVRAQTMAPREQANMRSMLGAISPTPASANVLSGEAAICVTGNRSYRTLGHKAIKSIDFLTYNCDNQSIAFQASSSVDGSDKVLRCNQLAYEALEFMQGQLVYQK